MTVSTANHADVYTDFQGLSRLRSQAQRESPAALREVARQFEAMFINMMVKSMRDASLGEGLLDNDQSKMFQGMYDQQLSLELSKGRGLGLADTLVRQLGGQVQPAEKAERGPFTLPARSGMPAMRHLHQPTSPVETVSAAQGQEAVKDWPPENPQAFVSDLWPHAEKAAAELGTDPAFLVAQAALESGWGKHVMQHGNGQSSYNLFGIKADSRWEGDRVVAQTVEFRDGVMQRERASFRSYASVAESFADYVNFVKQNPRYRAALETAGDGSHYVRELQRAGYATDPSYADKIQAIASGDQIAAVAQGVQHG